ncbi:MAG: efflux RND transporter periplasmic adaptor subunit [Gammaproteobacteria bacterium]|nr:efflux RND transporter periplasmic adaptor subunit [Gammaproteobacteria bacterium]
MTGSGLKGVNNSRASESTGKARPARLAYVDDSRTSAYVVKRMLKPYGYIVDHFDSAEPALIALVEQNFDLLLTDLKVSSTGMDGDDLVRALRASGSSKISTMPIIVITGATDTDILSQVYDAGANQIMTKPVNGEELDAHIRKLVFASTRQLDQSAATGDDEQRQDDMVVSIGHDNQEKNKDNVPILSAPPKAQSVLLGENRTLGRSALPSIPHPDLPAAIDLGAPQPATNVKPAARVMPTIKKPVSVSASAMAKAKIKEKQLPSPVAKSIGVSSAKKVKKPSTVDTALSSQAKASKQPEVKARIKPNLNASSVKTKKAIDQAALKSAILKKVKAAAAAKKTKLIEQHIARLKAAAQAKKKPPPFGLNRNKDEAIDIGDQKPASSSSIAGTANPAAAHVPVTSTADVARQAVASDARSRESMHTSALFEQQKQQSDSNILQQMDRFPLVQTGLRDGSSTTGGVIHTLRSVVELWGATKLLMSVVAIVILAVVFNFRASLFSEGITVTTTNVEHGEIFQSITVPGKVVSKLRVDLTPSIAGRLTNVYVEEGDNVKKGELLARLDDREAKINLKRAEANLKNAKEDVALAERSLKRLRQAFSKGAVARQLVEEAEVELRSTRARDSIAEEEVRAAKLSLENPRIVAPFVGTITARYVEVGQWVVPSETLFTLVDQGQREIEVQVDAADSGGIAVGQTVSISSDAFPGLNWPESVTRLAAAASNVGNANTVSVYVSLGSSAPSLRFGQQIDAEIRTAWNPSALKVPYGSIINRNGKYYVAVVEDNVVSLREVETGIEDFSHVEIRQGVSVGQRVILANGINLKEGDQVVISSN